MADGLYRAVRRLMKRFNGAMVRQAARLKRDPGPWLEVSWSREDAASLVDGLRQWPDLALAVCNEPPTARKALCYTLRTILRLRGPLAGLRQIDERNLSAREREHLKAQIQHSEELVVSVEQGMPGAGSANELNTRSGFPVTDSLIVTFLMYALVVSPDVRREMASALAGEAGQAA